MLTIAALITPLENLKIALKIMNNFLKTSITLIFLSNSVLALAEPNPFEIMALNHKCTEFDQARNVCATAGDFNNCMKIKLNFSSHELSSQVKKLENLCNEFYSIIGNAFTIKLENETTNKQRKTDTPSWTQVPKDDPKWRYYRPGWVIHEDTGEIRYKGE